MMNQLSSEDREVGKQNFVGAIQELNMGAPLGDRKFEPQTHPKRAGFTRREFMYTAAATAGAAGAIYFGYQKLKGDPVRAGLIGSGDEGLVLLKESNPEFIEFIAYSDIRPSNQKRAMVEDSKARKGFIAKYGEKKAKAIEQKCKEDGYFEDYNNLLKNPDIELVVIALPLHLHAPATIAALKAGKHVLCEKLMARTVLDGKKMIQTQREVNKDRKPQGKPELLLTIGHQRHYSILYDSAVDVIQQGLLGDIRHIRALWHRNNAQPGKDSWFRKFPPEDKALADAKNAAMIEFLRKSGYEAKKDAAGKELYKAYDELLNWRLFQKTGGGLMAELGSHQLDACSIFLGKLHPLAVSGVGGKYFYKDYRECEDHVFCSFEFPGKGYKPDKKDSRENERVVVTYTSINTNGFEGYGECVMGSRGTMLVDSEKEVMLYRERGVDDKGTTPPRSQNIKVVKSGQSTGPQMDAGGTAVAASATVSEILADASASRGYREEMEHLAYCIREKLPPEASGLRCTGEVALADAVIALTANIAMAEQTRIEFQNDWFNPDKLDPANAGPETDRRGRGNGSLSAKG